MWAGAPVKAAGETRTISMFFTHTKEHLEITYKRNGRYVPSAMRKINEFLRDWRADKPIRIDPELVDLLWELHDELGSKKPIHIISGFRARSTNKMLKRIGRRVASRSLHIQGKAADVYFPDVPISKVREAALLREKGGVGYYPRSGKYGFVHVDTGNVRHWPRMSKDKLAALFRDRKTRQRPAKEAPILLAKRTRTINVAENTTVPVPKSRPDRTPEAAPMVVASIAPIPVRPAPLPGSSGDNLIAPVPVAPAPLPGTSGESTPFVQLDDPAKLPDNGGTGIAIASNGPLTVPAGSTDMLDAPQAPGNTTLVSAAAIGTSSESIINDPLDIRPPPPPVTVASLEREAAPVRIEKPEATGQQVASLAPVTSRSGTPAGITDDIDGLSSQDEAFVIMRGNKEDRRRLAKGTARPTRVASLTPVATAPFVINRANKSDFGIAQLIEQINREDGRNAGSDTGEPRLAGGGSAPALTGNIAVPRQRPLKSRFKAVPKPRPRPQVESSGIGKVTQTLQNLFQAQ